MCEHGEQPNFTVKKTGKYPEHLKFIDILQFLAPGYNFKRFFKAFGVSEQKGFFPYDYFTSAEQLDETTPPPYETFYSTIKGCNILEEEHTAFQKHRSRKIRTRSPTNPQTTNKAKDWA